jgi:hypothetical protein
MGWLLGELAGAGITLPKSLDFKGILDLVLQVMGLTYNAIRSRAVKIVGEPVVKKIEQVAEVFKVLITEGPAGLWKWIVDKVDNLVDTVLGGIKDLVITKVVVAGITWLVSLLNPASAFVKACKMIYDVIMFFVERGSQIMALVNAIIDSVESIAAGAIGSAANWVENALGKALPVAISFLASLLGLGGLSDKIKKIIEAVQKPVGKAVDAVVNAVVKGFKKVVGFVGGLFGKGKDKEKTDDRSPQEKEKAEKAAVSDAEHALREANATPESVSAKLPPIKTKHGLSSLTLDKVGGTKYHVTAMIARTESSGDVDLNVAFRYAATVKKRHQNQESVILSATGTMQDLLLGVRQQIAAFPTDPVRKSDLKGNLAMAKLLISGQRAGKESHDFVDISVDPKHVTIYMSGRDQERRQEVQQGAIDFLVSLEPQGSTPTEQPTVQVIQADKKQMEALIKEMAAASATDKSRGASPAFSENLDMHSEQAAWLDAEKNDALIAARVNALELDYIDGVVLVFHSERFMCRNCVAGSRYRGVAPRLPLTLQAVQARWKAAEQARIETSVGSTFPHASSKTRDPSSTVTAYPPTGADEPQNKGTLRQRLANIGAPVGGGEDDQPGGGG